MFGIPSLASLFVNKYVIAGAIILALVLSGYIYYLRSSLQIATLKIESLQLEGDSLKSANERLEKQVAEIKASNESLAKEVAEVRKETNDIKDTLYRENKKKKSLEELALKKTTLIEKLVNKGTKEVFECFELLSRGGNC